MYLVWIALKLVVPKPMYTTPVEKSDMDAKYVLLSKEYSEVFNDLTESLSVANSSIADKDAELLSMKSNQAVATSNVKERDAKFVLLSKEYHSIFKDLNDSLRTAKSIIADRDAKLLSIEGHHNILIDEVNGELKVARSNISSLTESLTVANSAVSDRDAEILAMKSRHVSMMKDVEKALAIAEADVKERDAKIMLLSDTVVEHKAEVEALTKAHNKGIDEAKSIIEDRDTKILTMGIQHETTVRHLKDSLVDANASIKELSARLFGSSPERRMSMSPDKRSAMQRSQQAAEAPLQQTASALSNLHLHDPTESYISRSFSNESADSASSRRSGLSAQSGSSVPQRRRASVAAQQYSQMSPLRSPLSSIDEDDPPIAHTSFPLDYAKLQPAQGQSAAATTKARRMSTRLSVTSPPATNVSSVSVAAKSQRSKSVYIKSPSTF